MQIIHDKYNLHGVVNEQKDTLNIKSYLDIKYITQAAQDVRK